jgi:hypothetical protein
MIVPVNRKTTDRYPHPGSAGSGRFHVGSVSVYIKFSIRAGDACKPDSPR